MNHGIVPHIEFSDTERLFHALLLPVGAVVNFESLQQQEIDWDRFLELVRFHRVAGVVAHNLSDRDSRAGIPVPAPIAQQVTRAAKAQAAQALMRMKETASIAAALDHAGLGGELHQLAQRRLQRGVGEIGDGHAHHTVAILSG